MVINKNKSGIFPNSLDSKMCDKKDDTVLKNVRGESQFFLHNLINLNKINILVIKKDITTWKIWFSTIGMWYRIHADYVVQITILWSKLQYTKEVSKCFQTYFHKLIVKFPRFFGVTCNRLRASPAAVDLFWKSLA